MFKQLPRAIVAIIAACALWAVALAFDLVPQLRGDYGWRWPYESPQAPERLLPLSVILLIFISGGGWLIRQKRAAGILLWALVGSVALALASIYVTEPNVRYELYTRTISGGTTGWHYASTDMDDLGQTLHRWPEFMGEYEGRSSHVSTSPPGMPLLYYTTAQLFDKNETLANRLGRQLRAEQCQNDRVVGYSLYPGYSNAELASAWLGMLMPLWGALTVFPLYWLGRKVYSDRAARWGVLWWAMVPSALMFTPNPTPLYALLGLVVIGLVVEGLRRNQGRWMVAAGIVMSLATFLHFTSLPIIFLAGLFTLGFYWLHRDRHPKQWPLAMGVYFGVGVTLLWSIFYGVSQIMPWDILQQSFDEHLSLDRPYLPWLFLHVNDFLMFTGWPVALLAGGGLWQIVKRLRLREKLTESTLLTLCAALTVLVMDISGTTQGESGRIWLLMSPFVLLAAADYLASWQESSKADGAGLAITAMQGILLVVMVAFLRVISSGLDKPPDQPPQVVEISPTPTIQNGSVFGNAVELVSFSGEVETTAPVLRLWVHWKSREQLDTPYYVAFIPVAPNGQSAPEATVVQPFEGKFPVTCWIRNSDLMQDFYEIRLFDADVSGDWWVSMSLVNGRTGEKLPVELADGQRDTQIGLGPFRQAPEE